MDLKNTILIQFHLHAAWFFACVSSSPRAAEPHLPYDILGVSICWAADDLRRTRLIVSLIILI